MLLAWLSPGFQSLLLLPTSEFHLSGADSWVNGFMTLWVPPADSPMRLGISPAATTPYRFLQLEFLRLSFLPLELWVVQSASFHSCSS